MDKMRHAETPANEAACPVCRRSSTAEVLAEARWYPFWERADGGCPACVQQHLLETLLSQGHAALHDSIQAHWPLDAEGAFGALPTPLRLHAEPRFHGCGVTIALLDAGFYPHPDLVLRARSTTVTAGSTVS